MTSLPSLHDHILQAYQQAFSLVSEGVLWVDENGRIQGCNARAAQLLAYEEADLVRRSYFEVNPHYSLLQWKKFWRDLREAGTREEETEFMTAGELLVPVRLRMTLVNGRGYAWGLVVFNSLLEVNRFSDLLGAVQLVGNLGAWELNLTTNTFLATAQLVELLELPADRLTWPVDDIRTLLSSRIDEASLEILAANLRQAVKSGRAFEQEISIHMSSGEWGRFEVMVQTATTELNTIKLYGTVRDASTAARPAHQEPLPRPVTLHTEPVDNAALKKEEAFLRLHTLSLNKLREWVLWVDLDGKIVYCNDAAAGYLQPLVRRLPGSSLQAVLTGLELPPLDAIRGGQEEDEPPVAEYVFHGKRGRPLHLQITFTYLEHEAYSFICLVCNDITLLHKRDQDLKKIREENERYQEKLQLENQWLREKIESEFTDNTIVTQDPAYQPVIFQVAQVAETDATVLITGETGSGKELLARMIHNFSERSEMPLISVNCAALPENLIESELFGHEKGAFTGAHAQKKGRFELADKGTIFLDEVGELPLDLQAKLLRVLQEGEFQRVGGTKDIKVHVRVVAATNRNLEEMVNEGRFREDLYYRLNVFPIHNLPLRERRADIPLVIKHFTKVLSERMGRNITHVPQNDLDEISQYDFPGNVRELINMVERAVILTKGNTLNLAQSYKTLRRLSGEKGTGIFRSFNDMQRDYIIEALKRTKGRVTGPKGAAALLKLNDRTLMSKMRKFEIDRMDFER